MEFSQTLRCLLFCSLLVFLFVEDSAAQLGGQTVFNSLRFPTSARIAALGGNLNSVKDDDLHSALFNPALLDSGMHHMAALSYVNYFADVNMGHAAYAYRFDSIRTTVSAGIRYMSYGRFDETNDIGEEIGTFTAGDYIFTIGAGHRMDSNWTIGANLNFLYSQLGPFFASGASLDAAAVYERKSSGFTAALMVRNFGMQLKTYRDTDRESLPTDIQIGISKKLKHAPLRFSLIAENLQQWDLTYDDPLARRPAAIPGQDEVEDNQPGWVFGDRLMRHIVFGTEVLVTDNVHVRLGYNYRRRQELKIAEKPGTAGFSWGLGFRVKKIDFAYGRAIYHLAGPSHHFSVAFRTIGS